MALGLLTVFIGSAIAAIAKHIGDQVSVATIVLFQFGICFLCTLPWVASNGIGALRTDRPMTHIVRGVAGCLSFYAFYYSLYQIPLVDASLLRHCAPLIVPLILLLSFSVAIPPLRWLGLLLGFAGIAIILRPGQEGVNIWHVLGLMSGVGLAISMVLTRVLSQREPETRILFYYFAIALLFAIPFYLHNPEPIPLSALPWLCTIGLGMYIAFIPYTRAYRYAKASVVAPTSYFAIIFAGILDWLFWDYLPDGWTVLGAALVLVAGIIVVAQGEQ